MAFLLYRYLRKKYTNRQAAKSAPSTADEGHLVPGSSPGQKPERFESVLDSENATQARTDTGVNREENARIKAETRKIRIYRWKMIIGLLLPNFLAAVDVTIVAPAVPVISSHFSKAFYDLFVIFGTDSL